MLLFNIQIICWQKVFIDWDGNEIQYDENGNIITVQKKQTEKSDFTENFTEKQKQLIAIVAEDPAITTEISNLMGCSRTTVSNIISELKKLGIIERVGSDKKGTWKVKGMFEFDFRYRYTSLGNENQTQLKTLEISRVF